MANQFTDLKIVECNRLHSEEAKSNNDENFALWTTNLQDIIHLDAGDRVSVHGAMVSEKGAGQSTTLEIKGQSLGFTKDFNHTKVSPLNVSSDSGADDVVAGCDFITCSQETTTIDIRDDTGNFTMSYYVPANGLNYIDLPRRYWFNKVGENDKYLNWTLVDDLNSGMSFFDPFNKVNAATPVDKFQLYDEFYQIYSGALSVDQLSKLKKDNSRYTIMMAHNTYFTDQGAAEHVDEFPPQYLREPEYMEYFVIRELKQITAPSGFSSPDYIASEITRQLQSVTEERTFEKRADQDIADNADLPGFPIEITKTISTETYKPFNVASSFMTRDEAGGPAALLTLFTNASNNLSDGWAYLKNYHVVGCKRPELYETGRYINRAEEVGGKQALNKTLGTLLDEETDGGHYDFDISYDNKEYLDAFRDFILAQEKYPEIWNIFSDTRTPYNASDTIDNSRWCHINRYKNASMTMYDGADATIIKNTATLGWGGYKEFPWNPFLGTAHTPCNSVILPFEYDSSQRNNYYQLPDEQLGEKTYGCFGRSPTGKIRIYGTKNNGIGSALLTEISTLGNIEKERKIGFDQHFSATGVGYILPCDGYVGVNSYIDFGTAPDDRADAQMRNGPTGRGGLTYAINPFPDDGKMGLINQLYFGSTAPRLNYDGAHFSLSDLHTPMNSGNSNRADSTTGSIERQPLTESDIVYVINPREQNIDWTPARKPYLPITQAGPSPTNTYFNSNLIAWQIYDCLTGIMIEDFNLTENEWKGTLWDILGFSYNQFHSKNNTRQAVIGANNINDLSVITTNAERNEGDTKIYKQNPYEVPLFRNMIPVGSSFYEVDSTTPALRYYPEIKQKTQSVSIVADDLPTRMIRGYYTIRSNMLQDTPFIGGKVNNTNMPIIGIVNKINANGDFYQSEDSGLEFTVTKPLRLASITTSIHDPDGSFARCSDQSAILLKVQKNKSVTFNIAEEFLQEQQQKK